MSRENVEVVRSIYARWERGDFSATEWAHPEIEHVFADGPTPGRSTGLAGMTEGWREFLSAWEGFTPQVDEYRGLDDDRVLVLFRYSGRGRASGLEVGQTGAKGAGLYHVREGQVTRIVLYLERDHALEAVGLRE